MGRFDVHTINKPSTSRLLAKLLLSSTRLEIAALSEEMSLISCSVRPDEFTAEKMRRQSGLDATALIRVYVPSKSKATINAAVVGHNESQIPWGYRQLSGPPN